MTNLQLFHVIKNVKCMLINSRDKLPFVYSKKSLIFDLRTILLRKQLILLYCLIVKLMDYRNLYTELKLSSRYVQFYLGSHFSIRVLAAYLDGKVNHLNCEGISDQTKHVQNGKAVLFSYLLFQCTIISIHRATTCLVCLKQFESAG